MGWLILALCAALVLAGPKRFSLGAFVVGCSLSGVLPAGQLLGVTWPSYRVLIVAALLRSLARSSDPGARFLPIDRCFLLLGGWCVLSSLTHVMTPGSGVIYTTGLMINLLGFYTFARRQITSDEDLKWFAAAVAVSLIAVALVSLSERLTGVNWLAAMVGTPSEVIVRDGVRRARGTFAHPILAGSVAAASIPLLLAYFREYRTLMIAGLIASGVVILACASTGPILSAMIGVGFLGLFRAGITLTRMGALGLAAYMVVDVISNRRGYHVFFTMFDLTGSSTGYYRAMLLDTAFDHLGEWWLLGTDYTIHWIISGIGSIISDRHIDITNYYLAFGLIGGLPAVLLVGVAILSAFKSIDVWNVECADQGDHARWVVWCLGAMLVTNCFSAISVAFFDGSVIFFWLAVAVLAGRALHISQGESMQPWGEEMHGGSEPAAADAIPGGRGMSDGVGIPHAEPSWGDPVRPGGG